MVGVEAPSDYELVYHCVKNIPYFDTLAVSACLYPISQGLIDELGVDGMVGMNNRNMWYNGAYTLTYFMQGNEKVLTRNPAYWDTEASLFDTVTIRMIEDGTTDDTLFQTGEVDHAALNEATLNTILRSGGSNPYYDNLVEVNSQESYLLILNYAKNNENGAPDVNWNAAAANEAFRLSLYYGLDMWPYWARGNPVHPQHCENLTYTARGLLYFADGTDYADKVIQQLDLPEGDGQSSRRYNAALAEQYKAQAIQELSAKGVTFPVEIDYYISGGSQTSLDNANLLRQIFSRMGDDYIRMNIKTYVSSYTQEVITPSLHSFLFSGWNADYGDPETYLGQLLYGDESAYIAMYQNNINDAGDEDLLAVYREFTDLAQKAGQIYDDKEARYQAYADAEAYMLRHALMMPMVNGSGWQLTKINDCSKPHAQYGIQNTLYKNWETRAEPYTSAEYERFLADYNR